MKKDDRKINRDTMRKADELLSRVLTTNKGFWERTQKIVDAMDDGFVVADTQFSEIEKNLKKIETEDVARMDRAVLEFLSDEK